MGIEKVAKLEELSEERVEFFFETVGEYCLDERDGARGKCSVHGIIPHSTFLYYQTIVCSARGLIDASAVVAARGVVFCSSNVN